jgi:peptidase M1-like protein/ERAP1-like protein
MNRNRSLRPTVSFAAVLLVLEIAAAPARADVGRLPTDIIPTFEAIRLNLDADKMDYSGSVRVELKVTKPTKTIQFHAQEMKLGKVELRGKKAAFELACKEGEDGLVTATAGGEIAPGVYTIEIPFTNEFDRRATSLYRLETGGEAYTFTQFEAVDARLAFPCWDEPSFKFPYQITVVVPKSDEAVSNTPVERQTVKDGMKTVVFRRTKPLPSYLLAIATGPLEFVPIPGMSIPGRVVTPKGSAALAQVAVSMTPSIMAALEKYFGRKYPYEKLDLIAVPEFSPGAMENPGAITYGDRFLLFDPKTMSTSQRRTFAYFTAHEIAHMWFGDLVTMKWWDDLWLNESFADWIGYKIANEVYPKLQIEVDALEGVQQAMYLDAQLSTRVIRQPIQTMSNLLQSADPLTYKKGKATLAMFEQWIGPEKFRQGVLAYLKEHEWGNATADDLWAALSKAAGRDLHAPMSTFLDQPGVPMVRAEVAADGRVRLSQKRYLHYGVSPPTNLLWKIPVRLKYSDGTTVLTHSLLLSDSSTMVTLPGLAGKPPAWVHPNAGGSGYYRWGVDPATLTKLAAAAPKSLSPVERIGFLQNLDALLDAGEIHGDEYMRLFISLADEPRPEVAGALIDGIGAIKQSFITEDLESSFAVYVRRLLAPSKKRFGLDRASGEEEAVSLLRPRLLDLLADEGRDEEALSHAERLAKSFLADRGSVDPSLVGRVLVLSAIRGDAALFEEYKKRFEAATAPTDRDPLLSALGNFRDPKLREAALAYDFTGPVRPHEMHMIPQSMSQTIAYRKQVYEWLTKNYDEYVKRIPPVYAVYMPYYGASCEEDQLQKTNAFFSMPEHTVTGSEAELARVLEAGNDCVGLRAREGESVRRYLNQLAQAKEPQGAGGTQ